MSKQFAQLPQKSSSPFANQRKDGTTLSINKPDDRWEKEADQAAETVMTGEYASPAANFSFSNLAIAQIQREEPTSLKPPVQETEEEKYKKAATKAGEAALKTDAGKKLLEKVENDKLVREGKKFFDTTSGKIIVGAIAAGGVGGLIAAKKPLPFQLPDIPVTDSLKLGLKIEGPLNQPTSGMLTITFTESGKGSGKKSSRDLSRETEELRRSLEMFKPKPTQEKKNEESGAVQRKEASPAPVVDGMHKVTEVLNSPGQPLDSSTRTFMESRFGHDFSKVRIHTDERSAESARSVNALAYTVGQDIVFSGGQYAPNTRAGTKLIAHELTHTIQQGQAEIRESGLSFSTPQNSAEHEARSASAGILNGLHFDSILRIPPQIARQTPGTDVTVDPDDDIDLLENPYRSPGDAQAEEFRRGTISVVRDPILRALRRNDSISFLNQLRALDEADRHQLENDAAFMGEIQRALHGMSFWIVRLILHMGNNRPLYVRQLSIAVHDHNVRLIKDLLRTYRELRDPNVVPGVRDMLDYELRGDREHNAVLAIVNTAEVGGRSGLSSSYHEAHYERPKGGGAYRLESFTGTTDFTLARTSSELRIIVRIRLVEATNPSRTFYLDDRTATAWRGGIEAAWNNRFVATNGSTRLRVVFVPLFTEDAPNHTVQIDRGTGRSDEHKWYLQSVDGAVIAHEFGHMVGNPDEYRLPATSAEIPASMGLSPQETQRSTVQGITGATLPARTGGYSQQGIMGQEGAQVALPRHVGPVMNYFNSSMLQPGEAPYHLE